MKKKLLHIIIAALILSFIPTVLTATHTAAVTRISLASFKMVIPAGQKKTIKIKHKKKNASYSFRSTSKKIAKVNKKGVITGIKKGAVSVVVNEKYRGRIKCIGVITVKITAKKKPAVTKAPKTTTTPAPALQATTIPTANVATAQPTDAPMTDSVNPTTVPSGIINPTAVPNPTEVPIIYPETHEAPSDFDSKQTGIEYGTTSKISYYSSVTGKSRKANIILPANYTTDKKYPVLYLLHGIGGNEDEWLDGNPANIVGNLTAKDEAKEMIIVIPNARAGADDSYPADNSFSLEHFAKFDNFINDLRDCLMPYMENTYSIATGRKNTAIGGLSMGGRESLYIGLNMLDTFGYIAAFSPGYGVFEYTANGVTEPGLFTEETFTVPENYRNNTFLMIVNGIDEGGETALGGTCSKILTEHGVNHWFYVTEGAHNFVTWKNGLYNFARCLFK